MRSNWSRMRTPCLLFAFVTRVKCGLWISNQVGLEAGIARVVDKNSSRREAMCLDMDARRIYQERNPCLTDCIDLCELRFAISHPLLREEWGIIFMLLLENVRPLLFVAQCRLW